MPALSPWAERPVEAQDMVELSGARLQASRHVADRDELYANLSLRRRRAQMAARHASDGASVQAQVRLAKAS